MTGAAREVIVRGPVIGVRWTDEERETLRRVYAKGIAACVAALPDRSQDSITCQAQRLGLAPHQWTPAEDRVVQSEWGFTNLYGIARMLNRRTRSVYYRAKVLGLLHWGPPEGYEFLNAAAKRAGMHAKTLVRILAWARVKPRLLKDRPRSRSNPRRYYMRYVDPFDVDEAVAAWVRSETIEDAARSRGMCARTLRAWVAEANVSVRPRPGFQWRIPTSEVDRVIRERHAWEARTETLEQASVRVNVGEESLSRWLKAAGICPGRRMTRLDPAEVDRIVASRPRLKPTGRGIRTKRAA